MIIINILLALVLLLAPILAGVPDEPFWSSWLSAAVMLSITLVSLQTGRSAKQTDQAARRIGGAAPYTIAFAALVIWGAFSLILRLLVQHSGAYLGLMLRGWMTLLAEFALFQLCRRMVAVSRGGLYALILTAILGSAIVAGQGVSEYLLHVAAHEPSWRVFATSTPDFLAGYLVLLIPVTLALFLGTPASKKLPLLFGLVLVLQLATMLTTGSRFALVSLFVALLVMFGALAYAVRRGFTPDKSLRRRLAGIGIVVVLAGLAAAKPVLLRLHTSTDANSAAFRVWTWRGAAHMAAANPILGTGIGAWVDLYPRYALTGFTRLAHESYLQMADECGLPALAALLVTLGSIAAASWRALAVGDPTPETAEAVTAPINLSERQRRKQTPTPAAPLASDALDTVAPSDDRLLLCGLLGSLAAGVTQNLIDSDWYVFFLGITFWALAGLAVGVGERRLRVSDLTPSRRLDDDRKANWWLPAVAVGAALLAVLFGMQGVGAAFGRMAMSDDSPTAARQDYEIARVWDPLNARYPGEQGYRVEARTGNLPAAEAALRIATRQEPNAVNFRRLGNILDAEGETAAARSAYAAGHAVDPNSLDILLALAKDSAPPEARVCYQEIAQLEDSPVGRVRAIGEVTEVKFAYADAALGNDAFRSGNTAAALRSDLRAQRVLEAYADEGGTTNPERQVLSGNRPDPGQDLQNQALYAQVMGQLRQLSPTAQQPAVIAQEARYLAHFDLVAAQAYASLGDSAASPADAQPSWAQAAQLAQGYADARTQGDLVKSTGADDAAMRDLYAHVMDKLTQSAASDQMPTLQSHRTIYTQKFNTLLSKG